MESTTASRSGSAFGKFVSFVLIVGLIGLVVFLDMRRRQAEQQVTELSMKVDQQTGNPAQNQAQAKEIVDRVRKLYEIPQGVEPTVATIVDVNQLRVRNAFYNKAKNGDHLIVTNDRAILYDPVANKIIDVVPVQIEAAASSSSVPPGTIQSQTRGAGTLGVVKDSSSAKSAGKSSR